MIEEEEEVQLCYITGVITQFTCCDECLLVNKSKTATYKYWY